MDPSYEKMQVSKQDRISVLIEMSSFNEDKGRLLGMEHKNIIC